MELSLGRKINVINCCLKISNNLIMPKFGNVMNETGVSLKLLIDVIIF